MPQETFGSSPTNILDRFVSYSYQHFLLAGSSTESFRELTTNKQLYSLILNKPGNTIINFGNNSNAALAMVINTNLDSEFVIDGLSYTTRYASNDEKDFHVIDGNLSMALREPNGINFLNYLDDLSNDVLKMSISNIIFALKTVFVGHLPNGRVEHIELDPIVMILSDVKSSFDSSGGTYSLEFLPNSNSVVFNTPSTGYIERNPNFVSETGTLLGMIQNFQDTINKSLDEAYISFQNRYLSANNSNTTNKPFTAADIKAGNGIGKRVNYLITIPQAWKDYTITTGNTANYVEAVFEKQENKSKIKETKAAEAAKSNRTASGRPKHNVGSKKSTVAKATVDINTKLTVQQVFGEILKHCDKIYPASQKNKETEAKRSQIDKKSYKILTNITSDTKNVTIHFDVVEYYFPKRPANNKDGKKLFDKSLFFNGDPNKPRYGLILDYMFTGKNSQIKSLDMKFDEGVVYLNRNLYGGNKNDTTISAESSSNVLHDNKTGTTDKTLSKTQPETLYRLKVNDPIYEPKATKNQLKGYTDISNKEIDKRQEFISDHINLYGSFLNAKVGIRGNPRLLGQTISKIFPHNEEDYRREIIKQEIAAKESLTGNKDLENEEAISESGTLAMVDGDKSDRFPMFVKLNIMSPSKGGNVFAEPHRFWYDGWYFINSISHTFGNGEFEQELNLNAYTIYGTDRTSNPKDGEKNG